ncbi:hypothetical protein EJ03DRAFT_384097 [Teratosphaeria nubilosa]|uniref:Uncharacterized protein n=1 Tax=Teratosphaeria nubilosa TaxID=161662 RepID=A0A6G1L3V4_9PEZI|nr:hypothetical protein EJ03DRAFT_384097 [Teratosphaeria nubilosa]
MVSFKNVFIFTSVAIAAANPVQPYTRQHAKRSIYNNAMTAIGGALWDMKLEMIAYDGLGYPDSFMVALTALNQAIGVAIDAARGDPRPLNDADAKAIAHYTSLTTPGYVEKFGNSLYEKKKNFDASTKKTMREKMTTASDGFNDMCALFKKRMQGDLADEFDDGCLQVNLDFGGILENLQD